MSSETKKEGEFDPGCVMDIADKIHSNNFALRALSELLSTSDLELFTGPRGNERADNLRWGLSQIINLCIDHQESILSGYVDQYQQSDVRVMASAENCISHVKQGAFCTREAAVNALQETVLELDSVMDRGGPLDRAMALKESCLLYMNKLKGKEVAAGCARG